MFWRFRFMFLFQLLLPGCSCHFEWWISVSMSKLSSSFLLRFGGKASYVCYIHVHVDRTSLAEATCQIYISISEWKCSAEIAFRTASLHAELSCLLSYIVLLAILCFCIFAHALNLLKSFQSCGCMYAACGTWVSQCCQANHSAMCIVRHTRLGSPIVRNF